MASSDAPPPAKRRQKRSYTEAEIRRGLTEVALCAGNTRLAAKRLKEAGKPIPRSTLELWRTNHVERYAAVWSEIVPKVNDQIAAQAEAQAIREGELAQQLADKLEQEIPNLPARDVAGALRNVEVSRAVNVDKAALLRGMPTEIVERRITPTESLRQLRRLVPSLIVDSTAKEIEPAELPEPAAGNGSEPTTDS